MEICVQNTMPPGIDNITNIIHNERRFDIFQPTNHQTNQPTNQKKPKKNIETKQLRKNK